MGRHKKHQEDDDDDDDGSRRGKGKSHGRSKGNHDGECAESPRSTPQGRGKDPKLPSSRPGKLGFQGVEDDGAAQSKMKGLSSGARNSMRKKMQA